jgi:class 3 adenylate cyclase
MEFVSPDRQAILRSDCRGDGAKPVRVTPGQKSSLQPLLIGALAIGIFIFDTLSPLHFAIAVLYAVVVLIAASHYRRRGILMTAGACVALTLLSFDLTHGMHLGGTAPIRCIVSLAAISITTFLALKSLTAKERLKETERQRANLARFFSPHLVDHLMEIDTPLSVARCQPAAVMFVDMIDFTAYCSRMTPEAVIAMLRDLLALLSASVFAHNGTIDKFLGDGLMAVFGSPMPSPLDVTNAARCALDIQQSIDRWNERRARSGDAAIRVGVGIHYGEVVRGDVGSARQLELTVVGDTVNIASRVEACCRVLDAAVLVTAPFIAMLHAEGSKNLAERFADQGHHTLRGRAEPIHLYGLNRPSSQPDHDDRQRQPLIG